MNCLINPVALAADGNSDLGVWIVLIIAVLLFIVTGVASHIRQKRAEEVTEDEAEPIEEAPLPDSSVRVFGRPDETTDNGALVAAITAAIAVARAEAGESGAFRVVLFRRAGRASGTRRR